ncbi:hypothetical protein WA026_013859 [Henosepilachna vigintioctopunctata]|uniref:Uncharacterized protein n=1 Tax=Henosepilachna vigintioctopunctata TaxID=420089 RepID=A0AAW1UZP9_9CUCU
MKEYFQTALYLNAKYKLCEVLEKAGITPGTKVYKSSDFVNAITEAYGKEPKITCKSISESDTLLNDIRLCFDKSLTLIDCSEAGLNEVSCENEDSVKYPDKVI